MKICIVDDSINDIDKLKNQLVPYFDDEDTMYETFNDSLMVNLNELYDLYFLDIDMPNKDGYHLAEEIYIKYPSAKIIFCTMYDDFVFTSFQFNPFYFIRKRHIEEDIKYAINKFKKTDYNKYFKYTVASVNKKILLSEVIYIESIKNYVYFHLSNNADAIKIRGSIKEMQKSLNSNFAKVSTGIIINIPYIKTMDNKSITLKNNLTFLISRSYKEDFIYQYNKYLMEN